MFVSVSKYFSFFFLLLFMASPSGATTETQNVKIPAPQIIESEDSYTVIFPKEMALPKEVLQKAPTAEAPQRPAATTPPPAVVPQENIAPIPQFRPDFNALIQKCDKASACCRTSLRIVRDKIDAFLIKPNQQCPHGFQKGTLNCDGSFFWCEKL